MHEKIETNMTKRDKHIRESLVIRRQDAVMHLVALARVGATARLASDILPVLLQHHVLGVDTIGMVAQVRQRFVPGRWEALDAVDTIKSNMMVVRRLLFAVNVAEVYLLVPILVGGSWLHDAFNNLSTVQRVCRDMPLLPGCDLLPEQIRLESCNPAESTARFFTWRRVTATQTCGGHVVVSGHGGV